MSGHILTGGISSQHNLASLITNKDMFQTGLPTPLLRAPCPHCGPLPLKEPISLSQGISPGPSQIAHS